MKIAVASENGITVSRHFGMATQYVIINTEDGKILSREIRHKVGHLHPECVEHQEDGCHCRNHCQGSVYDRHRSMVLNILDCSILLVGGMGWGVQESLNSRGIKPVITDCEDIEDAVKLYISGSLPTFMERLN